jgi:tetratricopeptide (TPR) repeat protein
MGHPTIEDVQAELAASGRGLVVVGAGVAIAATAGTAEAALASWDGLLRHGIDHCVRFARKDEAWAAGLRARLAAPTAAALLAVAGEVCAALDAPGLGELGRWLQDTAGSFRAGRRAELEALRDLGLPLVTTNYDRLLEEVTGLSAATWQDAAVVEDLLRGKPPRAVLHLHGYWERPDSVILDPAAYRRAGPVVQELLKALRLSHTLLFVGCGEGLADPNWSALREWSREILAGSRWRHFRLCRTGELAGLEREHPPAERLLPVPYGPEHSDLAPFLGRLRPAAAPSATALPVASRCFGRDDEIEALTAALCALPLRPAAVLGPAGVGKTTLTLMALNQPRVAARFGGRRYFVRCAATTSRATLLNAIALALGLDLAQAGQAADPEARILAQLAAGPALLVLDNAETPWDAELAGAAVGFEDLLARLAALPELALAVSLRGAQRPVRLRWREAIALEPLAPGAAREAFLDVAGGAYGGDPLLDGLLAEVGHLPLAVVLLAAQAEGTPLATVRHRWRQERTAMLRRPGADPREASLEASISLSVASPRLTDDARRLASLLALLPDGMADDDLHAVEPEHGDDSSAGLRKVGLALPRDPRLRLYSPIREVLERTLPPTAAERERLTGHYRRLAELGERAGAEGGLAAFERLAPELGNLEAVLTPALAGAAAGPAITAVLSLVELAGYSGIQQAALFERALAAARRSGSPSTIARCLFRLGNLSLDRSAHDEARARFEEALQLYRNVGDPLGEAWCVECLGQIALERSDHQAARARYEEALPLYRRAGNLLGEANCILRLGAIALERSDYKEAGARYEEALQLHRRAGGLLGQANCILGLGDIALRRFDLDTARARYEEARPLHCRAGDLLGEANCIQSFGDIALRRSDHEEARARYEEAQPLYRRVGHLLGEANCVQGLGEVALATGDEAAAGDRFEQALDLYGRIPDPYSIGCAHRRLAGLARGDPGRREQHRRAARAAWLSIRRDDLVADLDRELPPGDGDPERAAARRRRRSPRARKPGRPAG